MKRELANRVDMGWLWYGANTFTESDKVGKFMTFGKGDISDELQGLILKAIKQGVTPLVKHTNPDTITFNPRVNDDSWVIVWYSSDDENCLKSLAKFLVDEGLVPKTKTGKLYNIAFKYDDQTLNDEYAEKFKSKISLQDLMNLNTGELL